jgi:hypothetical protein
LIAILGTFAILVVQTLYSFALIGFLARNHPDARHWFRTFLAPLIGGISMAAGDAAETLFFKLIPWIVVGVFLGGITLYLRARCPDQ